MHTRIQIYWCRSSIFRHLKLELLTQFPASNDEKYINVVYIWRKFVLFYGYAHWRMTTEISVMYGSEKVKVYCLRRWPNFESTLVQCLVLAGCDPVVVVGKAGPGKHKKWNESGFRPPLCTYGLNWVREAQGVDPMLDQCWANVADKNVVIVLYTIQYKNLFFIFAHLKSSSSCSSRELGLQFVTWTGWRWQWKIQAWKS